MLVSDYMSPAPVTIETSADYKQAFGIMQEKNLHHLPVVDSSNSIVGIVTRRDLHIAAQHFHEAPVDIGEIMHTPVTTIPASADLATAVDQLIGQGIGCLPVTGDSDTELVGIITEADFVELAGQLLTFARRQPAELRNIDLNTVIRGLSKMLRRLIGEDIDLAWLPGAGAGSVKVGPSQLDQILLNLCLNARDAMPDGGELRITVRRLAVPDADYPNWPLLPEHSAYADISGERMKAWTKSISDISLRSKADGNPYWGRLPGTKYDRETMELVKAEFDRLGLETGTALQPVGSGPDPVCPLALWP